MFQAPSMSLIFRALKFFNLTTICTPTPDYFYCIWFFHVFILTRGDKHWRRVMPSTWKHSKQRGVTAVPTFFMGLDKLVGAQPYEAFQKMVEKYQS